MSTKKEDTFVSVVAPIKNSQKVIESFLRRVDDILRRRFANYEVVLIDDASTDDSVAVVQGMLSKINCVRLIRLSRSFGEDIAISAGLESAIGDYVVIMNPEMDPPDLIPQIVEKARAGVGILTGVSISGRQGFLRRMLAHLFHAYCRRVLNVDLIPNSTQFRVLSRQAVNAVTQIHSRYRELRLLAATVGFNRYTFSYEPLRESRKPLKRAIADAIGLLVANSVHPLRFVSALGLMASALNFVYLLYVIAIYFTKADVAPGWTTLSFQHGVMFLMIFLILTVLSEYVGRLLEESQDRPLFFVLDEKNSSVLISDETRRNIVREADGESPGVLT